ncbi:tRNA (adenosine(37)-N6)-threonylcarbamoyltransferase complex dimerization subunit type 1 TsaB [Paenalcaligenes niemegkensis]|uniref:tRNA (adenosine(37)-N6)-threonylcarbamoyltransferase complex dimerization subunit type 1 TsaB n=1 Tax=Paenalcaligenes niemegkensis TaxID=2895469 RepID=UPI001EE8F003|nr:tRNA (adenosine(37)-N6)-threonylcarbamoyltransferase complex dimerization subunit type 1 TsaB [Paenalcaligenes niemegkensis]MCQ9616917.1 tRNA (adenosine(37)-N6)-threonylcarbamoyltransferase complex dimerization subunit type 1 TsaB [Paenalcaligenes niemegkensis]
MNTHILVLETSTQVCGVALLSALPDEPSRLLIREHEGSGEHAERILPLVESLLAEANVSRADLSAIAFGQGPGGFTGLRVACGVTQGLAYALNLPVIAVSSLLAVAATAQAVADQIEVVALDARMGEVYVAAYRHRVDKNAWETVREPMLLDAEFLALWIEQLTAQLEAPVTVRLSGDALTAFPGLAAPLAELPGLQLGEAGKPTVEGVAALAMLALQQGETIAPEQAMPLYVRDKVAFTTAERQLGQGGNPSAPWRPAETNLS